MKKYIFSLCAITFIVSACKQEPSEKMEDNERVKTSKIESLDEKLQGHEVSLPITLTLPIVISSNDSSILLFDYGDSKAKLISSRSSQEFFPLGNADNIQGGAIFLGIGSSLRSPNTLLIGSESNIRAYDLMLKKFTTDVDIFESCSSFNQRFAEIFEVVEGKDTFLVSQNGIPCINTPRDNAPFSIEEFESIKFVRVKNYATGKTSYTFKIPNSNEIIAEAKLHVRTSPLISYDRESNMFYCLINPTKQFLKYSLNPSSMEFELQESWDLNIPFFNEEIEYTLNKGLNRELSDQNLKYNPEFTLLKVINGKAIILYRPSKDRSSYDDDFLYENHYLLCIHDLTEKRNRVYALDYRKIFFLNGTNDGNLWFYNIEQSEMSETAETVISIIKIEELLS